jgi:hypothetical protein
LKRGKMTDSMENKTGEQEDRALDDFMGDLED